ncbi:MAG TPA: DUF922 domain-containing protein [Chitinophagaceae bacterium]|nr:DUF922 domain-containing protein [Chitinophagaceae bacterium]
MLYLLLIGLLNHFVPAPVESQFIDWSATRPLTWNDFKGRPPAGSSDAALTSSHIDVDFHFEEKGFSYKISCRFNKQESWARQKNDYILRHEQAHFDIAELYARQLNKALQSYRRSGKKDAATLSNIYSRIMNEQNVRQATYDQETAHSLNRERQEEWLTRIGTELEKTKSYADYR